MSAFKVPERTFTGRSSAPRGPATGRESALILRLTGALARSSFGPTGPTVPVTRKPRPDPSDRLPLMSMLTGVESERSSIEASSPLTWKVPPRAASPLPWGETCLSS